MRYAPLPPDSLPDPPKTSPCKAQQSYDVLLILDVEATCFQGTDFDYPNEIIEFPICLMKWQDRDCNMKASKLQVVDEFRSFVRPSWRPTLSGFCTELTGITQNQVDAAPLFPEVLKSVQAFLVKNGLVDDVTGKRLVRFCWCSDGPFDVRDFVVKQCFISKISMPEWLTGDILDVRRTVTEWLNSPSNSVNNQNTTRAFFPVRRSLNIPAQLKALGLPTFQGRQHSGIDDTRNIAKIVTELAKRGVSLKPNTPIKPNRKWIWMGKRGQVLEQFCASFDAQGNLASLPPSSPHTPSTPNFIITPPSTPLYGFGTATRPGSPAFWSPRRPDSPMSIVSSSPESEPEISVRTKKPPASGFSSGNSITGGSTAAVVAARARRGHQRRVGTAPPAIGIGAGVGVGVTATCVS